MLDLGAIDIEEIATALQDQIDFEHRWLIDPRTGELAFWTNDTASLGSWMKDSSTTERPQSSQTTTRSHLA